MAFDFSVTGNTKLDTSGFTQGVSSMTVAAGTLIVPFSALLKKIDRASRRAKL